MVNFIDRRLNGKNKSMVNRQRFVRRYKRQIKESLAKSITERQVTDHTSDQNVTIPDKDLNEPVFKRGAGGKRDIVLPGNDQFNRGDKIAKPPMGSGQGQGQGNASDSGSGEDNFNFSISADEYIDLLFEDLELPNLENKQQNQLQETKTVRSGYCNTGVPANLDIVRSLQKSMARKVAMTASTRAELRGCEQARDELVEQQLLMFSEQREREIAKLDEEIEKLKEKIQRVPFIDTFDLRFRNYEQKSVPTSKAVMFCLMDVSGSMTQQTKDMAKRFYIMLYLFLSRNYEHIDVVYITHHTTAKEVSEHDFFYSRETGGTIVSSALQLMDEIIEERYPAQQWNIYGAQASDGDNWQDDTPKCMQLLEKKLLPVCRYFTYIEINKLVPKAMWQHYQKLAIEHSHFTMRQIKDAQDIYPVFRELFKKAERTTSKVTYG
ncbi:YeaH/YhbH family protein [Thalassotalea ponticola]|uniref:YeaH/YhbH family protein n=1 Tax=Thalassotalea ponticola TaxID=1523392 RepID=UPI0025B49124|nr:YeaH/YhbH family protein [Thalassotalea ponticola]MDN3653763.1 YeaH/YhbH family protein [Thalassotalea ponticola]